ncbi:MAG: chromate transporter [Burkholderiaceae bacterium]
MTRLELALWLCARLALLSPLALGAGITISPDLYRLLVIETGLLDASRFAAAIALGQAAPGPNLLFVPLLGFEVAGLAGALLALAGFLLPSGGLVLIVARLGAAHATHPFVRAFRAGVPPVSLGLLLAAGWLIAPATSDWPRLALCALAALLSWRTRVHLLWLVLAGALAGAALAG